jgi:cytochrome P450
MMDDGALDFAKAARDAAYATPLERIDVGDPELFRTNAHLPYFERLRREDPVHFVDSARYGPFWSITRYQDIMDVDINHQAFSSEAFLGGITIGGQGGPDGGLPMFIAMDPPKHDAQRKVVSPIVSPSNLAAMEGLIRERAARILDELPVGEPFDWVDKVSIELTTQMLATLFDFPWEDRRKLTRWSDVTTALPGGGVVDSWEQKGEELRQCWDYFTRLWNQRVNAPPKGDLISMLAHGEATRHMDMREYHGNVILLIVGGNDTTRNSISGGVVALGQNPDQYDKLRNDPSLIASMVPEIIRWQTPLAHMRRTATQDVEMHGKRIKKGDKVVMWYVSGNRDEAEIENPNAFIIDRERPRHHMSFGFGIHRCVGNRLAEMQLRVIWEEILARFPVIEVVEEPRRVFSCFVQGYERLMVRIPRRY